MWQRISTNWNIFRIIRLLLGIMIMVQSIQFKEYAFVLVGTLFAGLALFDLGCAGGSCSAPGNQMRKPVSQKMEDITYEEVGK